MSNLILKSIAPVLLLTAVVVLPHTLRAQTAAPDVIFIKGRIHTVDANDNEVEALAISGERISAVGTSDAISALADADTRVVDLEGRTVIPGLIDSHIHAIRAGFSTARQVHWYDAESVEQAVERVKVAADELPDDVWIAVVEGWSRTQFSDPRLPTPAELFEAAGDHPVYIQHMRELAFVNEAGRAALGIETDADVPPAGRIERDADGEPTGIIYGDRATLEAIAHKLPERPLAIADEAESVKAFLMVLARLGMTGVVDPMGGAFQPDHHRGLLHLWRNDNLPIRVAYRLMSQIRGGEFEDYQALTPLLAQSLGDDMLKFNGFGEVTMWSMYDGASTLLEFEPDPAAIPRFTAMMEWMAERGHMVEMHVASDVLARQILDIFEAVNDRYPITALRWTFTHLENASPETLDRMKALGMGWAVQDRLYFSGERFVNTVGAEDALSSPRIVTAMEKGVVVGGGTDYPGSPYNPWISLRWFLDGESEQRNTIRGPEESPSRAEALRIYTLGSAWMSFDEEERGSLEPGKLADLAVLTGDYMTMPVEDLAGMRSLLTMVGGNIIHADGPFADLAE